MVAAVERKEGSVKRVWIRYRNKLKGLPLEFVRLAVADEIEAQNISTEAFEIIEKELTEGRSKALVAPELPKVTDKSWSSPTTMSQGMWRKQLLHWMMYRWHCARRAKRRRPS